MTTDEILALPEIPHGLRESSQRGTLIPFVGAGASRIAGCPSWGEFADNSLRDLVSRGFFSFGQLAQLSSVNPRIKLSLAQALALEHKTDIQFEKILHPTDHRSHKEGRRLYDSLSLLGKTFVTTNYDRWLDEELNLPDGIPPAGSLPPSSATFKQRRVIYEVQDLTPACLSYPDTVIHLHGSLLRPATMIMTTQDYVKHYANDRSGADANTENPILTFLEHLFSEKTVLFVGYGLEELEILEYVILKSRRIQKATPAVARHYLLQGFFSHERDLMRSLRRYYLEQCGIELIPFLRDHRDWNQLVEVTEDFASKVPATSSMVLQDLKEMGDLLT